MNRTDSILVAALDLGYKVNQEGLVTNPNGGVVKGSINSQGYRAVSVYVKGLTSQKGYMLTVHRLMAYTKFGDSLFQKGIEVRHLNGLRSDNKWDNIALGTRSENMQDIPVENRSRPWKGKANLHRTPVVAATILSIREAYKKGIRRGDTKHLAEKYNLTVGLVSNIGRRKSHNALS